MKGRCKLLDKNANLCHSHIFPKFAIDYMKKSGSTYLRSFIEPNRRQQDGPKEYFLCHEAEQKFSVREKWFAENIFYPYMSRKATCFSYNEDLFYFAISFLWRVIVLNRHHKLIEHDSYTHLIRSTESAWRNFLSEGVYPSDFDKVFIWMTDNIKPHESNIKGADYYITRILDCQIIKYNDGSYLGVYGKFLKFIFWAELKNTTTNDDKSSLRISPISGSIQFPQAWTDGKFTEFVLDRMVALQDFPETSDSQQDKIEKELMKNPEKFLNSEAFASILNDINRRK